MWWDKIQTLVDFTLHINVYLDMLVSEYGLWIYAILFLIIFMETGMILTPFLPGDSLIFAAGALAWSGSLNIWLVIVICIVAAILGDTLNYWVGRLAGEKLLRRYPKIVKPQYLEKTKTFFERYGGKTIILCRFVPIVRTVAPFMAGTGEMTYGRFTRYNIVGAIIWVLLFAIAGYLFANLPIVQENFSLVILAVIAVSFIPPIIEFYRTKSKQNGQQ